MKRITRLGPLVVALALAGCGAGAGTAGTASTAPSMTPTAGAATVTPTPSPPLLVVAQQLPTSSVVRLVRLDATDVASTSGTFVSVTDGAVVVLDGVTLKTIAYAGAVQTMGTLVAAGDSSSVGGVVVSPDRSQWLYSVFSFSTLQSIIHLGSATSDRVLTTLTSPDGNGYLAPFAWNASGTWLDLNATGIGGAGPFLTYFFPLWRFDLSTFKATPVSPQCRIVALTNGGTELCESETGYTTVPPRGAPRAVAVARPTAFEVLSPDGTRVALARNGGTSASESYQMATFAVDSTVSDFGPADFVPTAWLPDGRLVATHSCIDAGFQGAPCDTSKNGTYIFSADRTSSTLFFRWPPSNPSRVVACLPGTG
ncbi:MAG: hypothetical protein M3R48_04095 [Candidatus Dormibacteraeota bacterium]|nr:hypothetical protein [Candidatus Dormibacteraeota bacterium]